MNYARIGVSCEAPSSDNRNSRAYQEQQSDFAREARQEELLVPLLKRPLPGTARVRPAQGRLLARPVRGQYARSREGERVPHRLHKDTLRHGGGRRRDILHVRDAGSFETGNGRIVVTTEIPANDAEQFLSLRGEPRYEKLRIRRVDVPSGPVSHDGRSMIPFPPFL